MKKTALIFAIIIIATQVFSQSAKEISAFKKAYDFEKLGQYKKAADVLKTVYSNNSYEINVRLGWLEYNAGLFSESAAHYQKAGNLKPYSEEAKFGLIYPKAAQGKWNKVISLYNEILKISPNNTTASYRLGLIYYGKKDYSKANKLFKKVVDLYPFTYDALIMYAWTNYFLGKKREAKVLFNKVLLISPYDTSAKQGLKLLK